MFILSVTNRQQEVFYVLKEASDRLAAWERTAGPLGERMLKIRVDWHDFRDHYIRLLKWIHRAARTPIHNQQELQVTYFSISTPDLERIYLDLKLFGKGVFFRGNTRRNNAVYGSLLVKEQYFVFN